MDSAHLCVVADNQICRDAPMALPVRRLRKGQRAGRRAEPDGSGPDALPATRTFTHSAFFIRSAGWLEKDFVGCPHACETWEQDKRLSGHWRPYRE
jgi:hypothetical protein